MKGITQSREIVAAVAAGVIEYRKAKEDDGKVSRLEIGVIILKLAGKVGTAVNGAGEVLGELKDLDAIEVGILKEDISALLIAAGVTHRTADITEELLQAAFDLASVLLRINSFPPSAIAA
jgi:hypothetical protein